MAVDWHAFWGHVLDECRGAREWFDTELARLRQIPPPATVTDTFFLRNLAATVLGTGLSGKVMERLWPRLGAAFRDWDPEAIAADPEGARLAAMAVLRHPGKVGAVVDAALRLSAEPGVGARLAVMTPREALAYLQGFKFIGKISSYWLARELGFDVQHPDRLTEGIAAAFGMDANTLCSEIAAECGEREGTVDLVLYFWALWYGNEAFHWARLFAAGAGPASIPEKGADAG